MTFLALVPGLLLAVALLRGRAWRESPGSRRVTLALLLLALSALCTIPRIGAGIDQFVLARTRLAHIAEFTGQLSAVAACGLMIEWALIGSRRGRLLGGFRAAIAAVAATLTGLYLFAGLHFVGHPGILSADTTGSRLYATVYATAVVYGTGQVVRVAGDPARRRTDTVGVYTMFGVAGVFGISYGVGIFVCGLIAVRPEWITGWTWSTAGPAALCLAIAASLGWYAPSEPFRQALIHRCRARRRTELRFDIVPNPAPTGFHITLGPQLVSTEPTAPDQVRTVPESTEGPQDRAPEPAQAHRGH